MNMGDARIRTSLDLENPVRVDRRSGQSQCGLPIPPQPGEGAVCSVVPTFDDLRSTRAHDSLKTERTVEKCPPLKHCAHVAMRYEIVWSWLRELLNSFAQGDNLT